MKKLGQFLGLHISQTTRWIPTNLVCRSCIYGWHKYVNLIETSPAVIKIQGLENSNLAVPVNNTLVHLTSFLATDTQPCVLI